MRSLLPIMLTISLACSGFGQAAPPRDAVRPGTEVEIELLETISSETLHVGQTVPFKLVRGLESDGVTLLPSGTPFVGTVTGATARGHWGRAGAFDLKLQPLKLPDGRYVDQTSVGAPCYSRTFSRRRCRTTSLFGKNLLAGISQLHNDP